MTPDTPQQMVDFLIGYINTTDFIDLSLLTTWLSDWQRQAVADRDEEVKRLREVAEATYNVLRETPSHELTDKLQSAERWLRQALDRSAE